MAQKPLSQQIRALRTGLDDEIGTKLAALVKKCEDTGRAGTLTIALKLKPGKAGQIEIFDEIKVTEPKEERGSSLVFATVEGNLDRKDPRQGELEGIRVVEHDSGRVISVG